VARSEQTIILSRSLILTYTERTYPPPVVERAIACTRAVFHCHDKPLLRILPDRADA